MLISRHFLPILSSILLIQNVYSFPIKFTQQVDEIPTESNEQSIEENNAVDLHLFAQQLSTHLSFDHLELAYSQFSKKLSIHFQDLVQVTEEPVDLNDSVDLELLKGQLKGAVSSYVEDSLPSIWNSRASQVDKYSLTGYVENICREICPTTIVDATTLQDIKTTATTAPISQPEEELNTIDDDNNNTFDEFQHPHKSRVTVSHTCLETNSDRILSLIDQHVETRLIYIVNEIITNDLPPLFDTTQLHVRGILDHFERLLTNKTGSQFTLAVMNTASLGTSKEISDYLISSAHLNHGSESHSIRKFILPATLH
ncbi:hypothetical protein K501DRAFT_329671 [Backusella circina FSU 941]|nr:hypothetical protein K501DRAFT_329671 [Backusella circina FSU 941]